MIANPSFSGDIAQAEDFKQKFTRINPDEVRKEQTLVAQPARSKSENALALPQHTHVQATTALPANTST